MTFLTSPETVVQMSFLESLKPVFDQFLKIFQAEGPLVHALHQRYATSIEASDVQIIEVELNSREGCK